MTEQACHVPGCERTADPETEPFAVCPEHWTAKNAEAEVGEWGMALGVLRPWVQMAETIGFSKLTQVLEHAVAEAEWEEDLARDELERAEAAL